MLARARLANTGRLTNVDGVTLAHAIETQFASLECLLALFRGHLLESIALPQRMRPIAILYVTRL